MMPGRRLVSSLGALWFVREQAWRERWLEIRLLLFRALVVIEESQEERLARVGAVLAWLGLGCRCRQEVSGDVGADCQVVAHQ